MSGSEVFQPIGFDAFGIHTENYAIRVGEHPVSLTARTTARFRDQLSRTGMAWDWMRAIDTSRPEWRPLLNPAAVPEDIMPHAIRYVGRYALRFDWSDGHETGIYPWDLLRRLCPCGECA